MSVTATVTTTEIEGPERLSHTVKDCPTPSPPTRQNLPLITFIMRKWSVKRLYILGISSGHYTALAVLSSDLIS